MKCLFTPFAGNIRWVNIEVVQAMHAWGSLHHETIIGKKRSAAAVAESAS